MEITKKDIGNLVSEITLQLEPSDYKPDFDKEIKTFRQKAHLKGFRKGKTPISAIKKMYGKSVLADILNKKISSEVDGFIKSLELNILGEPLPTSELGGGDLNVNNFSPLTFTFKIGEAPDFEVIGLGENDVYEEYEVKIEKEMIDEEFQNIRKRYGSDVVVDKSIEEKDYISLKINELDEENVILGNGVSSEFGILVDRITDEYRNQILGKKKGFEFTLNIMELEKEVDRDFVVKYFLKVDPDTRFNENFIATVEGVKEMQPAELNDEFFEKAFHGMEIKTEEDALAKIKEELKTYYKAQGSAMTERYILEDLVERNNIDLPHEFLKEWLLASNDKATPEDLEGEYDSFEKSLRWSLIKQNLGKKHEVEVKPEDIKAAMIEKVKSMLQAYNYPGMDYDSLAETYMKNQPEKVRETFEEVYARKVFDKIMESVTLKKKKISLDDYKDRVKKMQEQN